MNHTQQVNPYDIESFQTRENKQCKRMMNIKNFSFDDDMSTDVPIDWEDELRNRADSYIDLAKEQILKNRII